MWAFKNRFGGPPARSGLCEKRVIPYSSPFSVILSVAKDLYASTSVHADFSSLRSLK